MFKSGTILDTPEKFESAKLYQLHVAVYMQGRLTFFGGLIQDADDIAIKINGSYYLRETCEFRVR